MLFIFINDSVYYSQLGRKPTKLLKQEIVSGEYALAYSNYLVENT